MGLDRAIFFDELGGDFLDSADGSAVFFEGFDHLRHNGLFRKDNIVAVKDGKRLVTDEIARTADRVAETASDLLSQEINAHAERLCGRPDLFDLFFPALGGKISLIFG